MSKPANQDQAAAPEAEPVVPEKWLNREVEYDGKKWVVATTDFATSYLPRRDGQPGRASYKRVLEVALEPCDDEDEAGATTAHLCVLCDFVAKHARTVATHQKVEHAEADDRPSRVYFPAEFREMTIDELRDMHRSYHGVAEKLKAAHELVAEERRLRREVERTLEPLRRLFSPKPASN